MSRIKTRIAFVAVHFVVLTAIVVFLAYGAYPDKRCGAEWRSRLLIKIYDEVKLHKEEQGAYPESLHSLLHYDGESVTFGPKWLDSKVVSIDYSYSEVKYDIHEVIRYHLVDNKPVISDLGKDANEGGLGFDMDIAYPPKYQKWLSFRDFTTTLAFKSSLTIGLLFSGGISACLLGMWARRYPGGKLPTHIVGVSILFIFFELCLLNVILYGHIYPTH